MFDIPDITRNISRVAVSFVPMLLGIVCHEVAHGWVAWKLGDPTAKARGRLTLNPLSHLDMTGSLLFVLTALFSPFILGWAKPVPVQPGYFRNPRKGMMLVAAAGPATNFLLAALFGAAYALLVQRVLSGGLEVTSMVRFIAQACNMGMWVNVTLAWFNLMPLPPLDGGHLVGGALPHSMARRYYSLSRYGIIILIVLLGSGLLRYVMGPLVDGTVFGLGSVYGIPSRFL